jgi:flagellin
MEEAQNIATTTSFNGQTLLNGAFQNKSFHIGAYAGETVKLSIGDTQTDQVAQFALSEGTNAVSTGAAGTITGQIAATDADGNAVDSGSITFASGSSSLANAQRLVDAFNADAQEEGADLRASVHELDSSTPTGPAYSIRIDSSDDIDVTTDDLGDGVTGIADSTKGTDNTFDTIDVTTREGAEKAIIIADYALKDVDATRSDIGSVQNQLESTIRNIAVTQVNVQAAESQIRDVDFAAESANFAKLNILAQSGSYAMSQANAVQQNVLRLLQ